MITVWPITAWIAARALIVSSPLDRADALAVLSGSAAYVERTRWAAHLYAQGRAPIVLLTNDNQESGWSEARKNNPLFIERAKDELMAAGVPASHVETVPGEVSSTYDECLKLRQHAEAHGQRSLLVITSPYHSRRAFWTLQHVFRGSGISVGIESVKPDQQTPTPTDWWLYSRGWQSVGLEYLKLVYYQLAYRK